MLVSKKEKRKTKEKMKRNAEHSATTTKFLLGKVATNHIEKRRELEKEKTGKGKKEKERKEKKRTRRKKTNELKNLVDPASSHMLVSKKEKRKTKENMKRTAEHSATTTKFLLGKFATNHIEKRRELEKKKLEKERKKRKEREERKQMK